MVGKLKEHWNQLEEYIWKWYPILNNTSGEANLAFAAAPRASAGYHI